MQWRETLEAVSDRAYLSRIAPNITAIGNAVATWIAGVPAKDALTVPDELDLRAIGLATGHAGIGAAIVTKFGDTNYDGTETQTSAPAPAAAHDSPLTRLDALLAQPVPSASEVLSMVGALGGSAERTTLIGDAARMTRIQNCLDDERFYQAIVVLRLSLTAGLTLLRQKGQSSGRVQSLLDSATALDRNMAVRDDANVTMVSTVLPDAPLQLFFRGSLDAATLAYAAWRTWVLDVTPVSILLPLLGGNASQARAAAQQLDAANAWGFLARVPAGPALSGPERDALTNLLAATGLPAAAATLRAKTTATTEPAAPALVVPPVPDAPAPVVPAPEAPAPQGPEVVAAEPTKRQLFEDEVQSATANATRLSQLAGELSQPDRDAVAATHRAAIIALLGGADLARFVAEHLPLAALRSREDTC